MEGLPSEGDARYKLMTLDADEFIRRFLIHVLPDGFHRIRHYGLLAHGNRTGNNALARRLLVVPDTRRQARTKTAPKILRKTASRTLVLAAAGV
jgi:Putative transposase